METGGESVSISGARSSSATMVASRPVVKRYQWAGAAISVGSISIERKRSQGHLQEDRETRPIVALMRSTSLPC